MMLAFFAWCGGLSCAGVLALFAVGTSRGSIVGAMLLTLVLAVGTWLVGAGG